MMKPLEKYLNKTETDLNLAVLVYFIGQGVSPSIISTFADVHGRRPVCVVCLLLYVCITIGLAVLKNYPTLMVLRFLQSCSISGTIAINTGIASDVSCSRNKGRYVGFTSALTLSGQALGPLISCFLQNDKIGGSSYETAWRAVWWYLSIGGFISFVLQLVFLIETNKAIVGDLSIKPEKWFNISPYTLYIKKQFHWENPNLESKATKKRVNLLRSLQICIYPDVALVLFAFGIQFACWTLNLNAISSFLTAPPYNYSIKKVAYIYLAPGLSGLIGCVLSGRLIDHNYRKEVKIYREKIASGKLPPNTRFNIIKARLWSSMPQNFFCIVVYCLFGWSIQKQWPIAVTVVMSAFGSYCSMSSLAYCSSFLCSLFPLETSSANASYNLIRCLLAALFTAVFDKMNSSITVGGTFSLLCGLMFVFNLLMYIPMFRGMQWIENREKKELSKS
ncbi:hypothetical protein FOG48_02374 [Hanseniaspora uvarum]|nr:hypothetical protein FOG48_02374 [Hanseniaspora uvarum]